MTHDSRCKWWQAQCEGYYCAPGDPGGLCKHFYCLCDLIAMVRADEKAKWTHVCPDNNCCMGTPE